MVGTIIFLCVAILVITLVLIGNNVVEKKTQERQEAIQEEFLTKIAEDRRKKKALRANTVLVNAWTLNVIQKLDRFNFETQEYEEYNVVLAPELEDGAINLQKRKTL